MYHLLSLYTLLLPPSCSAATAPECISGLRKQHAEIGKTGQHGWCGVDPGVRAQSVHTQCHGSFATVTSAGRRVMSENKLFIELPSLQLVFCMARPKALKPAKPGPISAQGSSLKIFKPCQDPKPGLGRPNIAMPTDDLGTIMLSGIKVRNITTSHIIFIDGKMYQVVNHVFGRAPGVVSYSLSQKVAGNMTYQSEIPQDPTCEYPNLFWKSGFIGTG
ncbi:hypothetical protein B0H14DRAFT_2558353 [Mycena olivaceomarginata]|nr:hypothetical protein B0H14DRAFT_2558353 [Mycena olivaceomarginata]